MADHCQRCNKAITDSDIPENATWEYDIRISLHGVYTGEGHRNWDHTTIEILCWSCTQKLRAFLEPDKGKSITDG